VITCSALKRSYRNIITGDRPDVRLVYLKGSPDLIRQRMAQRHGHFMPPALLDSQFSILEEPSPDENPIVADISVPTGGDSRRDPPFESLAPEVALIDFVWRWFLEDRELAVQQGRRHEMAVALGHALADEVGRSLEVDQSHVRPIAVMIFR